MKRNFTQGFAVDVTVEATPPRGSSDDLDM
jgi:hypothetical protein